MGSAWWRALARMWAQASRALRAEVRTYLAWAETSTAGLVSRRRARWAGLTAALSTPVAAAAVPSDSDCSAFGARARERGFLAAAGLGLAAVFFSAAFSLATA